MALPWRPSIAGLRKGHLLFLMRHWGFQSDLWRPKQSSSKSRKGSQKSLSDAKSSDQHARTGEARPSKRGQKRQGAEADIKNRDNSNKASNSQEIRAAQRMRLGPMEGVWMAKPDTRANVIVMDDRNNTDGDNVSWHMHPFSSFFLKMKIAVCQPKPGD